MTALIGTEIVVETPPKKEPKYFGFSWLTSLACGLPQKGGGLWIHYCMADLVKIKLNCKRYQLNKYMYSF